MAVIHLPYEPIPQRLYKGDDLFHDFDPSRPASWGKTKDFEIYRHFVKTGGGRPKNLYLGMMQALHDSAITRYTDELIAHRRVAGIMGGHEMVRDSPAYRKVAILARLLTKNKIMICTGGGPGAMEASHLGALLANEPDSELTQALARLKSQPNTPKKLAKIVGSSGKVDAALVAQAHEWFKPANEIFIRNTSGGESLAVPTWQYGHEPTTPFATSIAKYFQNSIREDGLLAIAKQGIVYVEGTAGTIQEIFQDGAQNYYKTFGCFSPMVLFGVKYWTKTYPVISVLKKLFTNKKLFTHGEFKKYVLVTDDVEKAAQFIHSFKLPKRNASQINKVIFFSPFALQIVIIDAIWANC